MPSPVARAPISVMHLVSGDLYAGAERIVEELAAYQHRSSLVKVEVVLLNEGELTSRLRSLGVPVSVFAETRHTSIALLRHIVARARELKPDLIHTHRFKEHVLGSLAARWCGMSSIRTVHGAPEFRRAGTLRGRAIGAMDHVAARFLQQRIVCVSEDLEHTHNGHRGSVVVIRNGIDPERVVEASMQPVEPLAGEVRVGIFARLVSVKRVHLAIDAVAEAQQRTARQLSLHIFGDGPLRSALVNHAKAREDKAHVIVHGHTPVAAAYMRQMDAMLLTSVHEGLPVAVLEAMSLGIPVVATRSGGLPEVLGNEGGWLVWPADAAGFATALLEATEPSSLRTERIQHSLERMASVFSARRMAEEYQRLYAAVLAERNSPLALSAE